MRMKGNFFVCFEPLKTLPCNVTYVECNFWRKSAFFIHLLLRSRSTVSESCYELPRRYLINKSFAPCLLERESTRINVPFPLNFIPLLIRHHPFIHHVCKSKQYLEIKVNNLLLTMTYHTHKHTYTPTVSHKLRFFRYLLLLLSIIFIMINDCTS